MGCAARRVQSADLYAEDKPIRCSGLAFLINGSHKLSLLHYERPRFLHQL